MTKGVIPDETPKNLKEQLLLEDAKAGNGKRIQGGLSKPLGDAPRLVACYGDRPEDWVKMASSQSTIIDGAIIEVHWFRNTKTLQDFEFKFKRTYPKTAPPNE